MGVNTNVAISVIDKYHNILASRARVPKMDARKLLSEVNQYGNQLARKRNARAQAAIDNRRRNQIQRARQKTRQIRENLGNSFDQMLSRGERLDILE